MISPYLTAATTVLAHDGLIIPNDANVNVTDEELGQIYVQLSFVNELVKNNLASIDRDDSGVFIGLKGNDDLFTIQANKNSFSVKWYGNRIRLSQSVMRRIDNAIDKAWDQFNSLTTTLLIAAAASIGKLITTGSVLNTLPTWLGVAIFDITAALTAFFSNPYVIAITIVILVTAAYNIWQIDKAAKWSTGTEIRTYGAWGPAAISSLSLALPHYRKQ